jgi:hypothetical protein
MVRRNTVLHPHIAEKDFGAIIVAAHRIPQEKGINHMHGITQTQTSQIVVDQGGVGLAATPCRR